MTSLCRLATVAAMLLHSLLGCSLHHACACDSYMQGEHQRVEDAGTCDDHGHSCHHDGGCDRDHREAGAGSWVIIGCECCENTPCGHDDSPCCSEVHCSFIASSSVQFSLDIGPELLALSEFKQSLAALPRGERFVYDVRHCFGFDDSLSRCALHCSWQI